MSMLPGDKFTLDDWKAAVKQPSITPTSLPLNIEAALNELHTLCKEAGVPVLTVLCSGKSTHASWDMGTNPAEVTGQYLMSRVTVCEDPNHAMAVAPVVMMASGVRL